jgi:hypothetical protein
MFDFKKISENLKGVIDLLDFFQVSGMERFEYNLMDKYHLTLYKVDDIIRIDLKSVSKS